MAQLGFSMSRIATVRSPDRVRGRLALEDKAPDAKARPELDSGTAWLYREQLSRAGGIEALFEEFDACLKTPGDQATGVPIMDASIVAFPIQRNSRDDKEQINNGEISEAWADKPARRRQIDTDARWTKKHGKRHDGHKNHVNIDRWHKLMRRYRA